MLTKPDDRGSTNPCSTKKEWVYQTQERSKSSNVLEKLFFVSPSTYEEEVGRSLEVWSQAGQHRPASAHILSPPDFYYYLCVLSACGGQKRMLHLLEIESQAFVSCFTRVLGTECRFSVKSRKYSTTKPSLHLPDGFLKVKFHHILLIPVKINVYNHLLLKPYLNF